MLAIILQNLIDKEPPFEMRQSLVKGTFSPNENFKYLQAPGFHVYFTKDCIHLASQISIEERVQLFFHKPYGCTLFVSPTESELSVVNGKSPNPIIFVPDYDEHFNLFTTNRQCFKQFFPSVKEFREMSENNVWTMKMKDGKKYVRKYKFSHKYADDKSS